MFTFFFIEKSQIFLNQYTVDKSKKLIYHNIKIILLFKFVKTFKVATNAIGLGKLRKLK